MIARLLVAAVLVPANTVSTLAGDAGQGEIVSSRCVACHGPAGVTDNPTVPNIAGQNGAYLFAQLQNFKAGTRGNPLMTPIAQALTPAELDDVATYFARLDRNGVPGQNAQALDASTQPGG